MIEKLIQDLNLYENMNYTYHINTIEKLNGQKIYKYMIYLNGENIIYGLNKTNTTKILKNALSYIKDKQEKKENIDLNNFKYLFYGYFS